MAVNWMDVSDLSFNALLLLERVQLGWLPGWLDEEKLAVALRANPHVEWYMRHKNPVLNGWLDRVMSLSADENPVAEVRVDLYRQAEIYIMRQINDLLVYALDPRIYAARPFLTWPDEALTEIVDFSGKRVLDIGAGTGRLTFVAAPTAEVVWPVEPVENLRRYLREKAAEKGYANVFPVDGLITAIPFPDDFADVAMGGHVFGDDPEAEVAEMERVTRPGGMVVFMPATNQEGDDENHRLLLAHGYRWDSFEEPEEGIKRKYWKRLAGGRQSVREAHGDK